VCSSDLIDLSRSGASLFVVDARICPNYLG
jgi:hypothetical protein